MQRQSSLPPKQPAQVEDRAADRGGDVRERLLAGEVLGQVLTGMLDDLAMPPPRSVRRRTLHIGSGQQTCQQLDDLLFDAERVGLRVA